MAVSQGVPSMDHTQGTWSRSHTKTLDHWPAPHLLGQLARGQQNEGQRPIGVRARAVPLASQQLQGGTPG